MKKTDQEKQLPLKFAEQLSLQILIEKDPKEMRGLCQLLMVHLPIRKLRKIIQFTLTTLWEKP